MADKEEKGWGKAIEDVLGQVLTYAVVIMLITLCIWATVSMMKGLR